MEKSYVKSWIWPIIHKKKGPERQVQLNQVCIIKVQLSQPNFLSCNWYLVYLKFMYSTVTIINIEESQYV